MSKIVLYNKDFSASNQPILTSFPYGQHRIPHWDRYIELFSHDVFTATPDPVERFWTCDAGLLVYLDPLHDCYVITCLDPNSKVFAEVPFDYKGRLLRRIRLRASVLIFEWAEEKSYHRLNDVEHVHRHFVTAFDVTPLPLSVKPRSEWKLHFLGFPLKSQDLWFSAHSETHYAVYIWQPNRSAWGEDEPIESLLVWDISQASDYRPSQDPSGEKKSQVGPYMVKRLSYRDLDYLDLRQRDHPTLRGLGIDAGMVYFYEMRSPHERGMHIGTHPLDEHIDRPWRRAVGVPIVGLGPSWTRGWKVDHSRVCNRLEHPCQNIRDGVAGINFTVGISNGKPWLSMEHEPWFSAVDIGKYDWCPWVRVHAEERWLVMQCKRDTVLELKILRFDHYAGDRGFALEQD